MQNLHCLQIEVDFVAICRLNGYDDTCMNKLFEMWPKLTVDILNARPQARSMRCCPYFSECIVRRVVLIDNFF